jgi:hypothetical protein
MSCSNLPSCFRNRNDLNKNVERADALGKDVSALHSGAGEATEEQGQRIRLPIKENAASVTPKEGTTKRWQAAPDSERLAR